MSFLLCTRFSLLPLVSSKAFVYSVEEDVYTKDYDKWINLQISHTNRSAFHLMDIPNLLEKLRMMAEDRATVRDHLR